MSINLRKLLDMLNTRRLTELGNDAAIVVNFLNNSRTLEEERTKISSLVRDLAALRLKAISTVHLPSTRDMRRAVKLIESDPRQYDDMDLGEIYRRLGVHEDETLKRLNGEDATIAKRISSALRDNVFAPALRVVTSGKRPKIYLQMCPVGMENTERLDVLFRGRRREQKGLHISWVILALSEIAKRGDIGRIRQCRCERWFFAYKSDKVAHSERCRKAAYEKTGKRRKARQEYMREYMSKYREKEKE